MTVRVHPPWLVIVLLGMATQAFILSAIEYPYLPYNRGEVDPQVTGWPLTEAERSWVGTSEYARKPGHEVHQHLPAMWPVTPTAAHWKGPLGDQQNLWIDHHATLIAQVQAARSELDIVLLGDSITQGWGGGWDGQPFLAAWKTAFPTLRTVNLDIGGDRTENVLWRLDHGALDGAAPRIVVLLIGVNNAPLVTANGVPAASVAAGVELVVENLRARCPQADIVVVQILPAFAAGEVVHQDIRRINAAVADRRLDADRRVHVLDLWHDFTNEDGSLRVEAYSDGHLHLGALGYERFAAKLKPLLDRLLTVRRLHATTSADPTQTEAR